MNRHSFVVVASLVLAVVAVIVGAPARAQAHDTVCAACPPCVANPPLSPEAVDAMRAYEEAKAALAAAK